MTMKIDTVSKEDLPSLADLYQQLLPNTPSLDKMEKVVESNSSNSNHIVLVAKEDGKIIGSLFGSCCEMLFGDCKSFMVVEDVIVDNEYRGKGVGSQLMTEIENRAKNNNCSYIMLITDSDRIDSQKFYNSLGYKSSEYCAFKKHL
jgi:ribosomal protein S18 acetylase RimI-like enzyme